MATTQKWVNLNDEVLDGFKGFGMCCILDSVYIYTGIYGRFPFHTS
jgi:hypothetical protein